MDITPDQFYKQWLRLGPAQATVSHFERQVLDFTATAGRFSQDRFQRSFDQGGFYGTGERWAERTSKWGRRFQHSVMTHTGLLQSTIDGNRDTDNTTHTPAPGRKAKFSRHSVYSIDANPVSEAWPAAAACARTAARRPMLPFTTRRAHLASIPTSTVKAVRYGGSLWDPIKNWTPRWRGTTIPSSTDCPEWVIHLRRYDKR